MKLPPGYVAGVGVRKATAYGGLGQKLMEKMGWSQGQGLGKEKDGMKEAIEVKKKEDTVGVGANAAWNWEQKYWEDAYNSAIQNINHEASGTSSSSSSGGDSDSSEDSGDRRSGKRARKGAASPASRGPVTNRDGTLASASAAELRIAAELAKDPWGRWGGRGGKMARIRAQEHEEANRARAKLGMPPLPVAPPPAADSDSSSSDSNGPSTSGRGVAGAGNKGRGGSSPAAGNARRKKKQAKDDVVCKEKRRQNGGTETGDAAGAGEGKGLQDAAPAKPAPKRLVVVLSSEAASAARVRMFATFKPTPTTGWWGAKMFASAGLMESLEDEVAGEQRLEAAAERQAAEEAAGRVALTGSAAVAAGQRRGFNEGDQEALYKRAHEFQRVGRRGLGKGEIKVGGAKWEGTKKTFDEDEDVDEDGDGGAEGGSEEGPGGRKAGTAAGAEDEGGEQPSGKKKNVKGKGERKAKKEKKQEPPEAEAEAPQKAKKRKGESGIGGGAAEQAAPQEHQVAEAQEADGAADAAEAPKLKWLKLARTVLKKSAERRVKLRKVVSELLLHAEEQHHQHHHKHPHRKHHQKNSKHQNSKHKDSIVAEAEAAGGRNGSSSPWDLDSVRQALERKIRKSNSGLAIDGKFLTMVGATDGV